MPETPEEIYERSVNALRVPPYAEWKTFPFEGPLQPRALEPPRPTDGIRGGEGGVDCGTCAASDDAYIWTNERWRLHSLGKPSGLPVVVMLEPREHYSDPGDLPDDLAADCGIMLGRVDRAIRSLGEIGRVHFSRWGDGGAHLHWWIFARPARLPQLRGTFSALWDDVLPPTPEDIWKANLEHVARELSRLDAAP